MVKFVTVNEYGGSNAAGTPVPENRTEDWAAIQNDRRHYNELRAASDWDGRGKRAADYYAAGRKLNPQIRYPDDTAVSFAIRRRVSDIVWWFTKDRK